MNVQEQIKNYIASQPEPKRNDMQELHQDILQILPKCKLWFLDGKDDKGKTVSNPNIGYGSHPISYCCFKYIKIYIFQSFKSYTIPCYICLSYFFPIRFG